MQRTFFDTEPSGGYFNTTELADEEVIEARAITCQQELAIVAIFRADPHRFLTPWMVLERLEQAGSAMLITSVRRSMTNLTTQGFLVRTQIKMPGPYGKPSFCWRLAMA